MNVAEVVLPVTTCAMYLPQNPSNLHLNALFPISRCRHRFATTAPDSLAKKIYSHVWVNFEAECGNAQ